jgi:hypothetical protein
MFYHFQSFKIEIINVKFITESGYRHPKTAIVTFFDHHRQPLGKELYGSVDTEEIYRKIKEGEDVILDQCYVNNFSLSVYREINQMTRKALVEIRGFSARRAFFDSQVSIDFSHAVIRGKEISFESALFARGKVYFNSSEFDGKINFSSAFFKDGNLDLSKAKFGVGDVSFNNAIMGDGIKDFQDVDFGKGDISFANTEFNGGEILFTNATFNDGNVSFKVARITYGRVDFHYSKFGSGDISFERTEFGDCRVDFRTVEFNDGRVNFNRSIFGNGEVNFEGSELKNGKFSFKRVTLGKGDFNFELAVFEGVDADFERTHFGEGRVSFRQSEFGTLSLHSCQLNNYIDLRVRKCEMLDLSDTIVRDILDLKPYDFPVDIHVLSLAGMRLLGTIYIDWKNNHVKQTIEAQSTTTKAEKAEQFRVLKTNFNQTGQYDDEDAAYVEFKRFQARSKLEKKLQQNRFHALWYYPLYGIRWLVLDLAGLYATAPFRVLLSTIGWYTLFSLTYFIIIITRTGDVLSATGHVLPPLARSFYHSAITFFTIGYGDHFPVGVARVFSALEGFSGVLLMSYFTVSLVRKILR